MNDESGIVNYLSQNKEWIFSGIGVTIFALLFNFFKRGSSVEKQSPAIVITNTNNLDNSNDKISGETDNSSNGKQGQDAKSALTKSNIHILFIDDDTKFQVVKILKNSGFPFVRIMKDVSAIDVAEVIESNILFIDIHGVGKSLQFVDEGLGLALAIKNRFPQKKIVIYSAETKGERFHDALRKADSSLSKNAEPYEFIQIIEELMQSINEQ